MADTNTNAPVEEGNPAGGNKPNVDAPPVPDTSKALAGPGNADPKALGTPQNPLPYGLVRQSRIRDRVKKEDEKDSSLKIKIELDLEVELDLYARVKGDVMIGLM